MLRRQETGDIVHNLVVEVIHKQEIGRWALRSPCLEVAFLAACAGTEVLNLKIGKTKLGVELANLMQSKYLTMAVDLLARVHRIYKRQHELRCDVNETKRQAFCVPLTRSQLTKSMN